MDRHEALGNRRSRVARSRGRQRVAALSAGFESLPMPIVRRGLSALADL